MKHLPSPRSSWAILVMLLGLASCFPTADDAVRCQGEAAHLIYQGHYVKGEALMCECLRNPQVDSVDAIGRRMTARFAMHHDSACLADLHWLLNRPELDCAEQADFRFAIGDIALHRRGDTAAAIVGYQDALAHADACGERQLAAPFQCALGRLQRLRGAYAEARAALTPATRSGDALQRDLAIVELCEVELAEGSGQACLDLLGGITRIDTLQEKHDYARARAYLILGVQDSVCPLLLRAAQAGNWEADSAYFNQCMRRH